MATGSSRSPLARPLIAGVIRIGGGHPGGLRAQRPVRKCLEVAGAQQRVAEASLDAHCGEVLPVPQGAGVVDAHAQQSGARKLLELAQLGRGVVLGRGIDQVLHAGHPVPRSLVQCRGQRRIQLPRRTAVARSAPPGRSPGPGARRWDCRPHRARSPRRRRRGCLRSIPASFMAAAFTSTAWPSTRHTMTGLSGVTSSISWCVGSAAGVHRVSSQFPSLIQAPLPAFFANSAMRLRSSAGLAASTSCTPLSALPPERKWTCASLKPGTTRRPLRSMTWQFGPASLRMSAELPTAATRPWSMAMASASGCWGSRSRSCR